MRALLVAMLATILGISTIYAADKNPKQLKLPAVILAQVADGYHVIDFATDDLNQDGVADVALIVEADEAVNHIYWRFPFPLEAPYILLDERDQEESDAALRSLVFCASNDKVNSVAHLAVAPPHAEINIVPL